MKPLNELTRNGQFDLFGHDGYYLYLNEDIYITFAGVMQFNILDNVPTNDQSRSILALIEDIEDDGMSAYEIFDLISNVPEYIDKHTSELLQFEVPHVQASTAGIGPAIGGTVESVYYMMRRWRSDMEVAVHKGGSQIVTAIREQFNFKVKRYNEEG